MKKDITSENHATTLPEKKLLTFIEAFYRIFKVGIYYPNGHVVLDQAASNCILYLREISPSLKFVKVEIEKNDLLVEGMKLPATSLVVKELYSLLSKLGIRSIEIERSISLNLFLSFVKNLLAWRAELERAQSFINFNVVDLPVGIRLEQQEFLVDQASIFNEDLKNDYRQNLDELCIALGKQGLNTQQVEQCREVLEKLSEPGEEKGIAIVGFPNATWLDVQTLLHDIITGHYSLDRLGNDSVANNDADVITSIFESLELSLEDKKSKDTVKFLISHLTERQTPQPETVKKSAHSDIKLPQLINDDQKISISELKVFIYDNSIPLKVLEQITSVDSSEEMSIILQLMSSNQNEQFVENLEHKLEKILIGSLAAREKDVLIDGIKHFADSGDFPYFRHLLSMVLRALRDSETTSSLEFVVELCRKMSHTMHLLLWPFVVNELLVVGMEENKKCFLRATEIASQMHSNGMITLYSQLEEKDAFKEKIVAETIFSPGWLFSYKLFAFLLDSSLGDILSEKIFSALLAEPQDRLFEAVGPLLEIENPPHLEFVRSYLAQAHLAEPPLALKMAAGQLILEYLQNISEEEKQLPWLKNTIAAMAVLYVKGMGIMLTKIVKDKKVGIVPTWPKNCRRAANEALKALKPKSLVELL